MDTRISRYSDEPFKDKDGEPIAVEPSARDLAHIFPYFSRYRRLRPDTVAALSGVTTDRTQRRMKLLARQPNKYLVVSEGHYRQPFPNSRREIFELSERGISFMKDEGLYNEAQFGDEKIFDHSMLICDTISALEIGAKHAGYEMVWWEQIAGSRNFPESTKKLSAPRSLPVSISYDFGRGDERIDYHYWNDSHGPFGVKLGEDRYRFFSLEAENKSYVDRGTLEKPSFLKKFLSMREIERKKLYAHYWGLPNLLHLVVCTSQSSVDARKALIMRETNGRGCSFVLFSVVPSIQSIAKADAPRPRPELFTQGWQRAGYPPVTLDAPLEGKEVK